MPTKKQILAKKIKKDFNLLNLNNALVVWQKKFPSKRLNYQSFRYHAHNTWQSYFIKLNKEILISQSDVEFLKYEMNYLVLSSDSSDSID